MEKLFQLKNIKNREQRKTTFPNGKTFKKKKKSLSPNAMTLDLNFNGTNHKLILKFKWKIICVKENK